MLAQVVVGEVEFRLDVIISLLGDVDATRLGQLLQARRDIDALAVTVIALDDDVAEVDADADIDAAIVGESLIALCHLPLHYDRALQGVDDTGELRQQPVAHQFEDVAVVLLDFRLEQLLAVCPQTFERTRFFLLHEPAVADHVGGKNGRKLAFHGTSRISNRKQPKRMLQPIGVREQQHDALRQRNNFGL